MKETTELRMNLRASEQNNNGIWDLTKGKNSFVLHTIFISDDCLNYSEQDATEKRSTKNLSKDQAWCQIVMTRDGFSNRWC